MNKYYFYLISYFKILFTLIPYRIQCINRKLQFSQALKDRPQSLVVMSLCYVVLKRMNELFAYN